MCTYIYVCMDSLTCTCSFIPILLLASELRVGFRFHSHRIRSQAQQWPTRNSTTGRIWRQALHLDLVFPGSPGRTVQCQQSARRSAAPACASSRKRCTTSTPSCTITWVRATCTTAKPRLVRVFLPRTSTHTALNRISIHCSPAAPITLFLSRSSLQRSAGADCGSFVLFTFPLDVG